MLKLERQRQILDWIQQDGKVLATDLCKKLRVSEDTVRRDLQELDEDGKLLRVHGGAMERSRTIFYRDTLPYTERQQHATEAKKQIARAAAALMENGQTYFMDDGTTTLQMAHCLPAELRARVITNSPPLAIELATHPNLEIVLLGGRLLGLSQSVVGTEAVEQIRRYRADLFFLGTCAVHQQYGITVPDMEVAAIKRTMMQCAAKTAGLATADKLDTVAPFVVAPVENLAYLIVDTTTDSQIWQKYEKAGIAILKA